MTAIRRPSAAAVRKSPQNKKKSVGDGTAVATSSTAAGNGKMGTGKWKVGMGMGALGGSSTQCHKNLKTL